jgi:hypothetical protein
MDELSKFWQKIDITNKKKETQLETYVKNGASENILRFIKLGGGPALGSTAEQFCKFKFNKLQDRIKGDTSHDHTIIINNKVVKIEQKTSTLSKTGDFMWQHVAEKHPWNILLLMAIDYKEIKFYAINKETFTKLVNEGKITNQGSKNKDSEQGMWFRYSNVKNDIIAIKTNEDIINLLKNDGKEENNEKEENTKEEIDKENISKSENSTDKIIIESKIVIKNKSNKK